MKLEIDINENYYKIICKRVKENKPYHSPYEYEVIADGKPIEQEPFINKPCVSSGVCEHDKNVVLDKIRDEIEEYKSRQLALAIGVEDLEEGKQIALEYVLAILDNYKAESEVEDGSY